MFGKEGAHDLILSSDRSHVQRRHPPPVRRIRARPSVQQPLHLRRGRVWIICLITSHHIKSAIFGPNLVRSVSFSSVEQPPTRRKFSGLLLPFLGDIVRGFQAFFCSGRNSSSSTQQDMARVHLTLDVMGGQRTLFTSWMTPAFAAIHSRFSAWVALL